MHFRGFTTPSRMPACSSAETSRQLSLASSKSASSRIPWKVTFFKKIAMPERESHVHWWRPQAPHQPPLLPPGLLTQGVVVRKIEFANL